MGAQGDEVMPKVHHVLKARKDVKGTDIKRGDSYYWWQFRNCAKSVSKTPPTRQQLTQSEFLSTLYDHEDNANGLLDELQAAKDAFELVRDRLNELAEDVRSFGSEQDDKRSNMEERFPNGCPTMDLLEARAERCNEIADELEAAASEVDSPIEEVDRLVGDVESAISGVNWDVE
jgi:ABC-type transporter Mla subunit MlaD